MVWVSITKFGVQSNEPKYVIGMEVQAHSVL